MAGHSYISIDGTLIETDRCRTPGPTKGVDLWWSGKHANHGGNIQVITAPDGWPLWTSPVRPGREHDTTALREHPEILPALATWIAENRPALGGSVLGSPDGLGVQGRVRSRARRAGPRRAGPRRSGGHGCASGAGGAG